MELYPKAHTCISLWERKMKQGRPGRPVSREYEHLIVQERNINISKIRIPIITTSYAYPLRVKIQVMFIL